MIKLHSGVRNRFILLGDLVFIGFSVLVSYLLRLELGNQFLFYLTAAPWMIGVCLLIKPIVYFLFGLYRRIWIYASSQDLRTIILAVSSASLIVSLVMLALLEQGIVTRFPRSVLVIDWLLSLVFAGGLRFSFRVLADLARNPAARRLGFGRRVLVIGAGDAGALVVRELAKNPQLDMVPVGFLDDDKNKQNHEIHGVRVVGVLADLERTLAALHVDEVIISIPSAGGRVVRMVADICRLKSVPYRTMPGLYELLGGQVNVSRLREVDITDLLRREPVRINDSMVGENIGNRTVLVTGAGGSIGREICRQLAHWQPARLILLGHGENSIFETLLELRESFPGLSVTPVIADIRHRARMLTVFSEHRPQVVFHAAAHKHVPLMELNITEAVTNNVEGTLNIVEMSLQTEVERLVLISTDKAIRPANVMGATKRIAEMIVLDAAARSGKAFSVVRFGNVLGSRGSVVPIFKRQVARGGPVTVTHPDMQRYFMTIPEAVHLVLQAAGMGRGGETFVLNMGQQVRILDLAEDLIRLSGLEPGRDIEIAFTGIRPGEKLSEDLWDEGLKVEPTLHPDIVRVAEQNGPHAQDLQRVVKQLVDRAQKGDQAGVLGLLAEIIPGADIHPNPDLEITSVL